MTDHERWQELGQQLRVDSSAAAAAAGSGHPTSSMSAADLMAGRQDQALTTSRDLSNVPWGLLRSGSNRYVLYGPGSC
jgi:transketolase